MDFAAPPIRAPRAPAAGRPVRRQLIAFAAALALPLLALVGLLLWLFVQSERTRLEAEAVATVRSARILVDRELAGLAAALETLAITREVQEGDLAGLRQTARALQDRVGINAVLRRGDGQQLVNPRAAPGAALPRSSMPEPDPSVWAAGRPVVSGVFQGAVAGEPLFAVQVPTTRPAPGQVPEAILNLSLPAERIRAILAGQPLPPGWILTVIDGSGRLVARTLRHAEFVGQPAPADFLRQATGAEGLWRGRGVDGQALLTAYAQSSLADWRVVVGVPERILAEPLRRSLWILVAVGAALLTLSLLLAVLAGQRITRSLHALAQRAVALGAGHVVPGLDAPVREVSEVGRTLAETSALLRAREAELRALNTALEGRVAERTADLAAANQRLLDEAREREATEAKLRQAQKMEAVGQLTGGVAHDFNNLLTVIMGNLAMVRRRLGGVAEERTLRALDGAQEGARRAAELTHRLLAFSRQQPLDPSPVDANRLVAGMSDMLRRTLGEDIEIETIGAAGLWSALVDPHQLENAILNLAVNARDAMPGGGKLTIETGNVHLDEHYAATRTDARAGQYVMVSVTDTGAGMPPEVIARVFEPFFTTKPVGKGTGLGLSQVYGFARQSGGHAAIYSEPGEGTAVKLYLPRLRDGAAVPADTAGQRRAEAEPVPAGRGEVVLLVEDDAMVREFATTALQEAGYTVLPAASGPEALAVLERHEDVALLFTDVVLTGPLNGRALSEEASRLRPGLKVLFTTGYTRNAIIHHGRLDEDVAFLGKPYQATDLARKLRQVLDGG